MSIRNAAKALILNNGKLLLNQCRTVQNELYYTLPGGGQIQNETMEEAVIRECLEETGYLVLPISCAALYEEIITDKNLQLRCPDYTHKIYHIFLCSITDEKPRLPTEEDNCQIGCEWVETDKIANINFHPQTVKENLTRLLNTNNPVYLGSVRTEINLFIGHV